jgi:Phage integrase central domain
MDAAKTLTFKQAAGSYIAAHQAGWKNAKHAAQWESTLATYAEAVIGALSLRESRANGAEFWPDQSVEAMVAMAING